MLYFLFGLLTTIFGGFTLQCLYNWFVIPLFPTLPHIGLVHAIGLNIFFTFLTFRWSYSDSKLFMDDGNESYKDKLRFVHSITCAFILVFILVSGFIWRKILEYDSRVHPILTFPAECVIVKTSDAGSDGGTPDSSKE